MKNLSFTLLFLIIFASHSFAQEYVQASLGANYSEQSFFRFSDLSADNLANESWDIAFNMYSSFSTGIQLNEAVSSSHTGDAPYLELYLAPVDAFQDVIDLAAITDTLLNDEKSWDFGAVNTPVDPDNALDFGWGLYNPADHSVMGNRVYVIKLWDNTYRKFEISSLIGGVYTFKYANLDGSGEQTVTITPAEMGGSPLALFSFDTGAVIASPTDWDFLFTRYSDPIDAGGGEMINYTVAGVLTAPGVEVAVASSINPYDINAEDYADAYSTEANVINYQWKSFNLAQLSWVLDDSLAYFVKTVDENLWKVIFVDFEGSSTGTTTMEVEHLGSVSTQNPVSNISTLGLFPNPVQDQFVLSLELKEQVNQLDIFITDSNGKVVWNTKTGANAGLNIFEFNQINFPAGLYILNVQQANGIVSTKMIKL